jgi:hypothetical protein
MEDIIDDRHFHMNELLTVAKIMKRETGRNSKSLKMNLALNDRIWLKNSLSLVEYNDSTIRNRLLGAISAIAFYDMLERLFESKQKIFSRGRSIH